jgi:hypothetical protein
MSKYLYRIIVEHSNGSLTEDFDYLFFVLRAARAALKAGMKVTITREEEL